MQAPAFDAPAADWLVYGDALQEAGDPRGELIGLSHGVAEGTLAADVRDAYVKKLLGEAAGFFDSYRFDWRCYLPLAVTVRIGANDGDRALALLDTPLAQELRAITLVGQTEGRAPVSLEPAMTALVRKRGPQLTAFSFIDERASKASMLVSQDFDPGRSLVTLGKLQPFLAFAEELHLEVADSQQLDLDSMDAPELRAFTLNSLRFTEWDQVGPMPSRLADAALPKLERYGVRLTETWLANIVLETNPYLPVYSERYAEPDEADDDYDPDAEPQLDRYDEAEDGNPGNINWGALAPLLQMLAETPVTHLALTGFNASSSLLAALDSHGLPPALEVLDLSDSGVDDRDAAWIASHPRRFAALKRLVLERTRITERGIALLAKLGPQIAHSTSDRVQYRYVVGSE